MNRSSNSPRFYRQPSSACGKGKEKRGEEKKQYEGTISIYICIYARNTDLDRVRVFVNSVKVEESVNVIYKWREFIERRS